MGVSRKVQIAVFIISLLAMLQAADLMNGQPGDSATIYGDNVPDQIEVGRPVRIRLRIVNTGTTTWHRESNLYRVGAGSTNQWVGCSHDNEFAWSNFQYGGYSNSMLDQRAYLGSTVTPNQAAYVEFDVTAHRTGDLWLVARMVHEGDSWFGSCYEKRIRVVGGSLASQFVSYNIPRSVQVNSKFSVSIRVKNVGSQRWVGEGSPRPVRLGACSLGVQGCSHNNQFIWPLDSSRGYSRGATDQRVYLPYDVEPGQEVTLTFTVRAPGSPGSYWFSARMVKDGEAWFGPSLDVRIEVTQPSTPPSYDATTEYGIQIDGKEERKVPASDVVQYLGARWIRFVYTDTAFQRSLRLSGVKRLVIINQESMAVQPPWRGSYQSWVEWIDNHYIPGLRDILSRHRDDIDAIEIWNEEDISITGGCSDCAPYVPPGAYRYMLQRAAGEAKRIAPDVRVVMGGLASGNMWYIEQVRPWEIAGLDFVGIHPYGKAVDGWRTDIFTTGDMRWFLEECRRVSRKEIWITEIGWGGGDRAIQAEYLRRVFSLALELRIPVVIWYSWIDLMCGGDTCNYGLYDSNYNLKPSGRAFHDFVQGLSPGGTGSAVVFHEKFESDSSLAKWYKVTSGVRRYTSSVAAHTGRRGAVVIAYHHTGIYTWVGAEGSKRYEVSVWVKRIYSFPIRVKLVVSQFSASGYIGGTSVEDSAVLSRSPWVQLKVNLATRPEAVRVKITLYVESDGVGRVVYFDDVVVEAGG